MTLTCPGPDCFHSQSTTGWLCSACWNFRSSILDELPHIWRMSEKALIPSRRPAQRISGGPGMCSRSPLRDSVYDARDEALLTLHRWAAIVRDHYKLSGIPAISVSRKDWIFQLSVDTLVRLDGCLDETPAGVGYYSDLYATSRRLQLAVSPAHAESVHIDGECWECGSATLCRRGHHRYVVCLTCGGKWGEAAWHAQFVGMTA